MTELIYSAREIEKKDNGDGYWNSLTIGVYESDGEDEKEIGRYDRNYHTLYDTFFPFQQNGEWYALYSKHYTATRIMKLPSCEDLGGEESAAHGFCPVDYYVPYDDRSIFEMSPQLAGTFGFVSGCHWGDDSSWKVQYLDLSQCSKGIIKRDDRFGYLELMPEWSLKKSVDMSDWGYEAGDEDEYLKRVNIAGKNSYSLTSCGGVVGTQGQDKR